MHSDAHDTQLYVAFDHKDPFRMSEVMKTLECCIADIRIWMLRNRLKVKESKIEMIVFSSSHVNLPARSVAVGGESL